MYDRDAGDDEDRNAENSSLKVTVVQRGAHLTQLAVGQINKLERPSLRHKNISAQLSSARY
jgi:hypothetical protein